MPFQGTFRTVKEWIHELRKNGTVDMVIAIAGNKCDLEDLREVRTKGMYWHFHKFSDKWD